MRSIRLWVAIIAIIFTCSASYAAKGDHYKCSVDDFFVTKTGGSHDTFFLDSNKKKTFEIYEFGEKFTVVSKSDVYDDSSTDYEILNRGALATFSIAYSSVSFDTLSVASTKAERGANLIHASISTHSPEHVNTWFLLCVFSN